MSATRSKPVWLFTLLCCLALFSATTFAERCLKEIPEVAPKKYIHYEQRSLNITLEVSDRVSHNLISYLFKILVQERLGYPKVEIKPQKYDNAQMIAYRLAGPLHDVNKTDPDAMINLEVWVPPNDDVLLHYVKDCGSISPPGRVGWFVPKRFRQPLEEYYKKIDAKIPSDIHWSIFTSSKIVKAFDITDVNLLHTIKQFPNVDEYIPENCGDTDITITTPTYKHCAVLLAPDKNSTQFIIKQIEGLELRMRVIFLGKNLKAAIKKINDYYTQKGVTDKSYVFLSRYPSEIVYDQETYLKVTFSACENDADDFNCRYEPTRLHKYVWTKLEKLAPNVELLARNLYINEDEMIAFLKMYNEMPNASYEEIACKFYKEIMPHIPITRNEKPTLYIGGIFPITGSSYSGKGIYKAAAMATKAVNNNSKILSNYNLQLFIHDGECSADQVMKIFIDYIKNEHFDDLVGVLGPACSETVEPLAGVSKHYKSLIISYSAEGASFSDRKKYPYFFRTIGENQQYKYVYLKLFQELGWKQIAALTEDGLKYTEYISHMQTLLKDNNIELIDKKFPKDKSLQLIRNYLLILRDDKNAKIIIADVFDQVARAVMCEAYKLDMTAKNGFVWFLPTWLNTTWYNTTYYNKYHGENVNCTIEQMVESIKGYMTMTHAYFAADNEIMQENITVGEWRKNYDRECESANAGIVPSSYAGYAYDAVWTYALALDQLIKDNEEAVTALHGNNTTKKLMSFIEKTDFNGVSGRIKFHGPSRISSINLMQWYNKSLHPVAQYIPNAEKEGDGNLTWNDTHRKIHWFTADGNKPEDGRIPPPVCAIAGLADAFNVSCDTAIILLNIIIFSILIAVVTSVLCVIKKRMKIRYKSEVEKAMKSLGLDIVYPLSGDLDKWEIPRESVVINRKLGEGAFGTVYGGEANFSDKGWYAVAVKTLKVGSSTNEKVDFLSEAEVMKRFDHKNIVKLLGVCTKQEPVYTIMEYMLYGDLKTYLLARRHLVNNNAHTDAEDISPKRLTAMALDVARGLSYLAEMKYVHRDIASRNCLINAQRVVKLGDFGMTRPVSENDYYRFHRKGMLPVRWMSPESLALGMFTPASDVWSYGVLLYEIVTFGSFPFQGLSNNQVLEHVKAGNTIPIPAGIKMQLEGLLKSCWQQEPKARPQASEIVEFLANNPRLIQPSLDIPFSSVQMEDTGQLEMHIPNNRFRKSSSNFSFLGNQPTTPNGSVPTPLPIERNHSIPESGSYLHLDNCCPREPLLGGPVRSNSLLGLTKYVTIQHNHFDSGCEHDESDESVRNNGCAVTKV